MSLLERNAKVSTRYGGGFVQSIQGRAGSSSKTDWFYYVNGVQAPMGAATTNPMMIPLPTRTRAYIRTKAPFSVAHVKA